MSAKPILPFEGGGTKREAFIHCEAMVYNHTVGVYIIAARRISSAAGCIFCFRNDDMQFLRN